MAEPKVDEQKPEEQKSESTPEPKKRIVSTRVFIFLALGIALFSIVFSIAMRGFVPTNAVTPTYMDKKETSQYVPYTDSYAKDIANRILTNQQLTPKDYEFYLANKDMVDSYVKKFKLAQQEIEALKK